VWQTSYSQFRQLLNKFTFPFGQWDHSAVRSCELLCLTALAWNNLRICFVAELVCREVGHFCVLTGQSEQRTAGSVAAVVTRWREYVNRCQWILIERTRFYFKNEIVFEVGFVRPSGTGLQHSLLIRPWSTWCFEYYNISGTSVVSAAR